MTLNILSNNSGIIGDERLIKIPEIDFSRMFFRNSKIWLTEVFFLVFKLVFLAINNLMLAVRRRLAEK